MCDQHHRPLPGDKISKYFYLFFLGQELIVLIQSLRVLLQLREYFNSSVTHFISDLLPRVKHSKLDNL
jgi:hypothetical protein